VPADTALPALAKLRALHAARLGRPLAAWAAAPGRLEALAPAEAAPQAPPALAPPPHVPLPVPVAPNEPGTTRTVNHKQVG